MTIDTTSTGMPPIAPAHDALETMPNTGGPNMGTAKMGGANSSATGSTPQAVQSLVGEGKTQIANSLSGLGDAVREIATKLESNGAGPIAKYVHDAADAVSGWSKSVDQKSVDDLVGDTKTLVRTSPALAVGIAVAAGFVVSRVVRSGR